MASEFENLGLLPQFLQAVEQLGYTQPTPIQISAIPALLAGRNVLGQAQTGTGKTAAFVLPMLQQIEAGKKAVQALVLAPTRELALQVAEAAGVMAQNTRCRVLAVYGGQPYHVQIHQLERGVEVVVGTPGRLLDLINKKLLDLSQVRYLVLDEADEMLEMGFIDDVELILAQASGKPQMALFSATLPDAVRKLADRYLSDPLEITTNSTQMTVAETEQRYCMVREDQKLAALTRLLEVEDVKSALIFARTKARAQELADEMNRRGIPAEALHGDLNQARREFVLNRFRQHASTLLVATDVAARGLDIDDVTHVFNYDAPTDPDDYVHRIGRTGRAGRKGVAITFLTPRERSRLKFIEAFTHTRIKEVRVPNREEILARRDERFLERLGEQLVKGKITRERAMLAKFENTSFDMLEIAAAAIQLARASEPELQVEEIYVAPAESRTSRTYGRKPGFESNERSNDRSARRPAREWQNDSSSQPARGKGPREWQGDAVSQPARSKGQREPGMVRLWMNLGETHGVRPGDVVGAIASEVGIPGKAIGEIDIRRDFTFLDVAEKHVRQVLKQSDGSYFLRGKPVMLKLAD